MCTVSYLPLASGGYILTSNRDEAPQRNASDIRRLVQHGQTLIYPVDPGAGGSWFCLSDHDKVACLLNGAYLPFTPDPKYSQSRGTALLESMYYGSLSEFASQYDFTKTAPFTLVKIDDNVLQELIWDGNKSAVRFLDPDKEEFWSSVTLYPENVRNWRRSLFHEWVDTHVDFDQDSIMHFHRYGSEDPWNGFVMNRGDRVKTLSISSVMKEGRSVTFKHTDLTNNTTSVEHIELISADVAED